MNVLLLFAAVLVVGILLSELADRTVLSTAALFLVAGFLSGEGAAGLVEVDPAGDFVTIVSEVALFVVLFTDGMRAGARDLAAAWRLPGRALVFGLPLTLVATALLARVATDLSWAQCFLVGAALAPTDPVFASALVGREGVPRRLSHLLNVESGLNDGLALPIVLVLLGVVGEGAVDAGELSTELGLGVLVGVATPYLLIRVEQMRFFRASIEYEPLYPFAIGLLIFSVCSLTHANLFLAAFSAGVTVTTLSTRFRDAFHKFGDLLGELLKLFAVLVFGVLISPELLFELSAAGFLFAISSLLAPRPLALAISFAGSGIARRELFAAAWFGPKGFASVVYGLLVLDSGAPGAEAMFHLIAAVVALSILLHSSSDVFVASRFRGVDIGETAAAR